MRRVKNKLTGFLLIDLCTYCGFAAVPHGLKQRLGIKSSLSERVPVLTRAQAKEAMRICFEMLGEPVVKKAERACERLLPNRETPKRDE